MVERGMVEKAVVQEALVAFDLTFDTVPPYLKKQYVKALLGQIRLSDLGIAIGIDGSPDTKVMDSGKREPASSTAEETGSLGLRTGGDGLSVFKTPDPLLGGLFDRIEQIKALAPNIGLPDSFKFGIAVGPDGRRSLLAEDEFRAWQASRQPPPPAIQAHLREACQLKKRLERAPGLSKVALAAELGVSRFGLIQTLSLARLSPEIQRFIQALPPGMGEREVAGILSKEALWRLAAITDLEEQNREFKKVFLPRFKALVKV